MALERHADLHDAPAENDKTDGADQTEDEIAEVVHDIDGIAARRESNSAGAEHHSKAKYGSRVDAETLLDLYGSLRLVLVFSAHFSFPPFSF